MSLGPQNPKLTIQQIQDKFVRENFDSLDRYFRAQNQLLDFKFFEVVFTEATAGYKLVHGFSYVPLDILVTHISRGNVTFKYGEFDRTFLVLDVSGACRVRFFAGSYPNLQSSEPVVATDKQVFKAVF